MKIEVGKIYLDGFGHIHEIFGYTKYNKDFVWSLSQHFRQEDGRVIYNGEPRQIPTPWDLVKEYLESKENEW